MFTVNCSTCLLQIQALMVAIRVKLLREKLAGPEMARLTNTQFIREKHTVSLLRQSKAVHHSWRLSPSKLSREAACRLQLACLCRVSLDTPSPLEHQREHGIFLIGDAKTEFQLVLFIPAGHISIFLLCHHPQGQSSPGTTLIPGANH